MPHYQSLLAIPYVNAGLVMAILIPLAIWSLIWKGLALWVTAKRRQPVWFVIFLLVNSAGILEIIYLLATNGFQDLSK